MTGPHYPHEIFISEGRHKYVAPLPGDIYICGDEPRNTTLELEAR